MTRTEFKQKMKTDRLENGRLPYVDYDGGVALALAAGGSQTRDGVLTDSGHFEQVFVVPCDDGHVLMVWRRGPIPWTGERLPPEWRMFCGVP